MGTPNVFKALISALTLFLVVNKVEGHMGKSPKYCGLSNAGGLDDRIVNGKDASPHMYPWMAKVFRDFKFHCGGSLISDRWVLTAGHCVADYIQNTPATPRMVRGDITNYELLNPATLDVELASHNLYESLHDTVWKKVIHLVLHPEYDTFASEKILMQTNDIALLNIEAVHFTSNLTTICLPLQGVKVKDFAVITVAGWGSVLKETLQHPRTKMADILQTATLKKIPWEVCHNNPNIGKHLAPVNKLTDREIFCMIGNHTDSCRGDSGGPAFSLTAHGYVIVGLISWGIGCNLDNYPGVYTQVSSYVDFIKATTIGSHFLPIMLK